ncbi:MAG TPA: CDP-alcohol phosphatidyltransferase family protein [Acidimicrobiales bacterium]|jgi:CDP-diacylglycerol--glycerol-3-phosphate 3-phosphatidyltransferase|nr:CDP-alcohol phosphatidyltransferase family protein [Acidimicrobiales bacterium]
MFDGRWRNGVDRTTSPIGQALHRHGITADVLTATGLVSASATAVLVATGHLHWAIVLLIVTGLHDLLDGPVAKAAGTASVRGAFFDSVTDRVADAVLMFGASWYLLNRGEGHLALLPMAILAVTSLVSYERAKAESLGLQAKGGLMERGERMFLFGVACLSAVIFVPVLWVLLVLISFTAIARFVKVWNAASGRDAVIRRRIEAWREGRVDSRWRAWRESREPAAGRPHHLGVLRTTSGAPVGRWRARRQESLSSRSGRTLRERRRVARGHGTTTSAPRRLTNRRPTPPPASGGSGASS